MKIYRTVKYNGQAAWCPFLVVAAPAIVTVDGTWFEGLH